MLKLHMDARENALVAISRISANSGHSLHKGTPREAFIRECRPVGRRLGLTTNPGAAQRRAYNPGIVSQS